MNKLRAGDEVLVIAGKDKGKKGIVSSMEGKDRVVVEGVNISKKHQKPNPNKNEPGGITTKTMPIHISNILAYDSKSKKSSKVGFKDEDGKKVRILKTSGEKY